MQLPKALYPISPFTLDPNTTLVSVRQPLNTFDPMPPFTLFGIETLVILSQLRNAPVPIVVTVYPLSCDGIFISPCVLVDIAG